MNRAFTTAARAVFLQHFAMTGNQAKSARLAGVHGSTVYHWRRADPAFEADCLAAHAVAAALRAKAVLARERVMRSWRRGSVDDGHFAVTHPQAASRGELVFVPRRHGGPAENPYPSFNQLHLLHLWWLARAPYPEETADHAWENGALGAARYLEHWLAYRVATLFVWSNRPFEPAAMRTLPPDSLMPETAADLEAAFALDLHAIPLMEALDLTAPPAEPPAKRRRRK